MDIIYKNNENRKKNLTENPCRLFEIDRMPKISGIMIPNDFYWVLQKPCLLAGMRLPKLDTPWNSLYEAGFRFIVNLTTTKPQYDPLPLQMLRAVELTDLYGGENPRDPEKEEETVMEIAKQVVEQILKGEGVIIHCVGGRGRTGTVLGSILVMLGYSADHVIQYLDKIHKSRGRDGWPESPWQAEMVKKTESNLID